MPLPIKRFVHRSLEKLGYRLVRMEGRPGADDALSQFFSLLKRQGFSPRHIIDVGANHGNWTRTAVRFFPDAQYTLIEPQGFLQKSVQDLLESGYKIKWITGGAGDAPGKLAFTLAGRDDSSTFDATEEEAKRAGFRQVLVEVKTLNEIVRSEGLPADMVKIDAEGLDLKVLVGASELLGHTDIFLVEVNIHDTHKENALEPVIKFMNEKGYRLMEITDVNRSPKYGLLWLCEMAFLKNSSTLLNSVTSYE
jgi:FkbM family methyltransferase